MEKTKVLYISQEITPFLPESEISNICRHLPQGVQESGMEIRTFMPRYGVINERRNQLHEVIRLSGMNIIIDDYDHPLIIKVASLQAARMQVYFIDNEEYFHRKSVLKNKKTGEYFEDNDERALFFARGVLETVNKLQWRPDIIHCHGWFTFAVPLLLKKMYSYNTLFSDSKIVYSLYKEQFQKELAKDFNNKINDENISKEDLALLETPNFVNVSKFAMESSDAFIVAEEGVEQELVDYAKITRKPLLEAFNEEEYVTQYMNFYNSVLGK